MKKISLANYDVTIGDISQSLGLYLSDRSYTKIAVLVDEQTKEYCLPKITPVLSEYILIEITSGESHKTLGTCEQIWSKMGSAQMDRHSLMINLGGGVIGDMGGFAASCYMRGIDFIQIPTTLLSQVDASVGGKLAIDFQSYKNFIGLFCDPQTVLVDPDFILTLSSSLVRSGYAEMIKHGLIQSKDIWHRLSSLVSISEMAWADEIYESILIKKQVVEEDPREGGLRKILNFGHTIGHALESYALHTEYPLLHGEAIALGMIAEAHISKSILSLSEISLTQITAHIRDVYHDIPLDSLNHSDRIYQLMGADKKNKGGKIRAALLEDIGQATYDITLDLSMVEEALAFTKVELT